MSEEKKRKFVTADEFRSRFSPERRAAIEARTKVLIEEHLSDRAAQGPQADAG